MKGPPRDGQGGRRVGPPGGVNRETADPFPWPEPVPHQLAVEYERGTASGVRGRLLARGREGAVGDPHGGQIQGHSHVDRQAGATEVLVSSANRWALMHEHRGEPEPSLTDLLRHLTPVDLLIVEGFKREPHDKIEVFRRSLGKPLIAGEDPHVIAVASDGPVPESARPLLALNDIEGLADFVVAHCGLTPAAPLAPLDRLGREPA